METPNNRAPFKERERTNGCLREGALDSRSEPLGLLKQHRFWQFCVVAALTGAALQSCSISFAADTAKKAARISIMLTVPATKAKVEPKLPLVKEAKANFDQGHYGIAAEQFENLCKANPQSDLFHYYAALAYHYGNQIASARLHYQWVANNSANPHLRDHAKSADKQLAFYGDNRTYLGKGNDFSHPVGPKWMWVYVPDN